MSSKCKHCSGAQDHCDFPLHAGIRKSSRVLIRCNTRTSLTPEAINKEDQDKNTALHLAAERGYDKWVDFLIGKKSDLNRMNKYGMSPLMLAVRHQHPGVVLQLLNHGANVHLVNNIGQTAMHYVCCTGDQISLKYLLQHKAKLNVQDSEGVTPLIIACKMGLPQMIIQLLQHKTVAKANPNIKDKFGRTPLHWSAELGHADCTKALIAAQVDLNPKDGDYETPFVRAIKRNSLEVLDVLIHAGCDRADIDGLNGTAMTMAALLGRTQIIEKLLSVEEDINEFGHIGFTPLTAAVFECHVDMVALLLDSGADPDKAARMGSTPLVKATAFLDMCNTGRRHEITKLLLRANADPNLRVTMAGYFTNVTKGRNCPLSFACSAGCISLAKMHLIGGCRITVSEVEEWIEDSRNNDPDLCKTKDILIPLLDWVVEVRSLKFLSRKVIRACIGEQVQLKLEKLPVPKPIRHYLNLGELDNIKVEFTKNRHGGMLKKESFMPAPAACGLRSLQGTLCYETLGAPAYTSRNTCA